MTILLCDLLYDDTCYGFDNLHCYRAKQLQSVCSFQSFAHQNLLAFLFLAKHSSKQLNCCAEKQLLCLQFQLVSSVGDTLVLEY